MTPLFALLFDTLDERLKLRAPGRKVANKVFPHHWSFLLGEVALIAFAILVLTGIFLTMFYRPSTDPIVYEGSSALFAGRELPAAFESIVRMTYDVPGGLFFRRVHRAAAHVFVAATILHLVRIMLTGAFRKPREVNWVVGFGLLTLTLAAGVTGYSLPFDALAGTGIRIMYSVLLSIPLIGDNIAFWVFGGPFPTGDVIPRFYVTHVLIIPLVLVGGIATHLLFVGRQRHTQFPRRGVDGHRWVVGKPLWPAQFAESTTLMLWLGGIIAASAVLVPWADITLQGPYVAGEVGNNAQPEWYIFFMEGALRIIPPFELTIGGMTISQLFVAGVLLPGILFGVLFIYPWLEKRVYRLEGDWHVLTNPLEVPLRSSLVGGTFVLLLLLSAAATNDILSRMTGIPVEVVTWIFRVASLVVPPLLGLALFRYGVRRLARQGRGVDRAEPTPEAERVEREGELAGELADPIAGELADPIAGELPDRTE
jgi:ubiquinol-cytochrome c reductase cytochrome b subunit